MDEEAVLSAQDLQNEPEKVLPVSRVNEIVKREKSLAAEKVRRELESQYAEELSRARGSHQPMSDNTSSMEDRLSQRLRADIMSDLMAKAKEHEEAEAKRQQEELERKQFEDAKGFINDYVNKVSKGKEFFDDFEEVMGPPEDTLRAFPQLAYLAMQHENTPAVMYELAKNPMKLASLQKLAEMHPQLAEKEMAKLAQSISQNQQALQGNVSAQPPLSRLKSTQSTGVDSGKMSIADFKNADWLRPTR